MLYLTATGRPVFRRDLKADKWLPPIRDAYPGALVPHPDGKRLLILGEDGVLRRYDLQTLRELPATQGFVGSLAAIPSPDGRQMVILSGDEDRPNRLDMYEAGGRHVWSLQTKGYSGMPHWSPDGRWLACVGRREVTLRESRPASASASYGCRVKCTSSTTQPTSCLVRIG